MKTEQILNLDFRKEENKEIIQKVLRKIKPLSKYSDEEVPLEAIEKTIKVLTNKYDIMPQWMGMNYQEPVLGIYSIGVKTASSHEWIGNVYGMCVYEVFAKLAIKMYADVKKGRVKQRVATKEEKQRERKLKQVKG